MEIIISSNSGKPIYEQITSQIKAMIMSQRDGFIETTVGRGSFVSARNKDFYQEEQQRQAEAHLQAAAEIARAAGIPLAALVDVLTLFYEEE